MFQIKNLVDGYQMILENESLTIEATDLKKHRDERLTGELLIKSQELGYTRHLHQAQFNFSSTRTRSDLIRTLNEKHKADWVSIIEKVCLEITRCFREGDPVLELEPGKFEPPEYVVAPLLVKNYPTVIFGDPSCGKSTLACIIAIVALLPWKDNPLGIEAPPSPYKVLYLDYETDKTTVGWQLRRLLKGGDLPFVTLYYRYCALPLALEVKTLKRKVEELGIDLLIIDSLGLACGGELKEAQFAVEFFSALRKLERTSLILAHTAKNPENPKKRSIFGSVFFSAQARSVWEMVKRAEPGEESCEIALYHQKPPPFSELHKPIGFQFRFSPDAIEVGFCEPKTVGEFLERMTTQERIRELLSKKTPLKIADIVETLSLPRGTVDSALKRLRDKKLVVKIGDAYGLTTQESLSL